MYNRFEEVSEDIIKNHKSKINEYRWKLVGKRILLILLAVLVFYIALRIGLFDLNGILLAIIAIAILLGFVFLWFVIGGDKKTNEYLEYYKTNVIVPLLTIINDKIEASVFGVFAESDEEAMRIVEMTNDYHRSFDVAKVESVDVLGIAKCKYEKFVLNILDIYTEIGSGQHSSKVFAGLFTSIKTKRKIDGVIAIRAKKFYNTNHLGRSSQETVKRLFRIQRVNKPKVKTDANDDRVLIDSVVTPEIIDAIADYVAVCKVKIDIAIQYDKLNIRFHFGKVLKPSLYLNPLNRWRMKDTYEKLTKVFALNRQLFTLLDSQASQKNL